MINTAPRGTHGDMGRETKRPDEGARLEALRKKLGLSQDDLAASAETSRQNIGRAEDGRQISRELLAKFATGLGLHKHMLEDYLEGTVTLEQTAAVASPRSPAPAVAPPSGPLPPWLDEALSDAFDKARHMMADLRAVETLAVKVQHRLKPGSSLVGVLRGWLDIAAQIRKRGRVATFDEMLAEERLGRADASTENRERARQTSTDADIAAKAKAAGVEPPQASAGSKRRK